MSVREVAMKLLDQGLSLMSLNVKARSFVNCCLQVTLFMALGYLPSALGLAGDGKWTFETGGDINSSPAIGSGGVIYIGSTDAKLYAVNADGTLRWSYLTGAAVSSSPAVAADGTVYVGSDQMYAFTSNGSLKWTYPTGAIRSSPAIGADGTIFLGGLDGKLYALNPDGSLKWSFTTNAEIHSAPAIGPDGKLYIGTSTADGRLYAINPDGSKKWAYVMGRSEGSPAIGADGTLYAAAFRSGRGSKLFAIRSDGTLKWSYGANVRSSPSIGADGTIYVAENGLTAVNADGTLKWRYQHGQASAKGTPAVGADGTVYVGFSSNLVAVDLDGSLKWEYSAGFNNSSPAVSSSGVIYIGSHDNFLHAVESDSAGLAASPWPMFRQNAKHTGLSPISVPEPIPGRLRWFYNTGGLNSSSSPAIAADGTLYVADTDNNLNAFDPEGSVKWSLDIGNSFSSPGIGADGTVYIGSQGNTFSAINPDGSVKWVFNTVGNGTLNAPAFGVDGTIIIGRRGGFVYAIKPNGSEKWRYPAGPSSSSPAVAADGTIYIGLRNNQLLALNHDGTLKWILNSAGSVASSPAIGIDGAIYFGSEDGNLYAINPDGTVRWSFATADQIYSSPAIAADGTVYVGSYDNKLYAINADGSLKWSYSTGDSIVYSSPAIGVDGTVYVGSDDKYLYALNADGTLKWRHEAVESISSSPAIGDDGTIYVNAAGYTLAIIGDSGGLADTAWPMFHQNAKHTGRTNNIPPTYTLTVQVTGNGRVTSSPVAVDCNADCTADFSFGTQVSLIATPDNDTVFTGWAGACAGTGPCDLFIGGNETVSANFSPTGQDNAGNLSWFYTTQGAIGSSAAIGVDGSLYVGSDDKHLYAFNTDGSLRWSYDAAAVVFSSPTIANDGTIYVGAGSDLHALNSDGTLRWVYTTGSSIYSSPAVAADGTVYVGSYDNKVYAINPDGSLLWFYTTSGDVVSSPAIGRDGTVYVGSLDHHLYALNPDGTLQWRFVTGAGIYASPAIATDGTIYVGSFDSKLYAINSDGSLQWSYTTNGEIYSSVALGADGAVYVGSFDHTLYALNADGSLRWSYTTNERIDSSPTLADDGTVYVGSRDKNLYALFADGALKWSFTTSAAILSSPVIGNDGTVYVGSADNNLYAIVGDSTGLAKTAWPMFGQNLTRNAQADIDLVAVSFTAFAYDLIGIEADNFLSGEQIEITYTLDRSVEDDAAGATRGLYPDAIVNISIHFSEGEYTFESNGGTLIVDNGSGVAPNLFDAVSLNGFAPVAEGRVGASTVNSFAIILDTESSPAPQMLNSDEVPLALVAYQRGRVLLYSSDQELILRVQLTASGVCFNDNPGAPDTIIIGTDSADVLNGTVAAERICGLAGVDSLQGLAGNDFISAGAGDDVIDGGPGNDFVNGNQDNDIVYGGTGNDEVHGGKGDDVIYGDAGDDLLRGDEDNDTYYFSVGDGNDIIDDNQGVNIVNLEAIPLTAISVNAVTDTLVVNIVDSGIVSSITILNYGDGSGFNLVMPAPVLATEIVLPAVQSETIANSSSNFYQFTATESAAYSFNLELPLAAVNDIDVFLLDTAGNVLSAGQSNIAGDESFTAQLLAGETYTVEVRWITGVQADSSFTLKVSQDATSVDPNLVSVTFTAIIYETSGSEVGEFSNGEQIEVTYTLDNTAVDSDADPAIGQFFDNALVSAAIRFGNSGFAVESDIGSVITRNNIGDDPFLFDVVNVNGNGPLSEGAVGNSQVNSFVIQFVSAASASPQMLLSDALPVGSLDYQRGFIFLFTSSGDVVLRASFTPSDVCFNNNPLAPSAIVIGSISNDELSGSSSSERICGLSGSDTLLGLDGDDFISGGELADNIDGGPGNDFVNGNTENDIVRGGSGNDEVHGGKGDDTLYGDAGNDLLFGDEGSDTYIFFVDGGTDVIDDAVGDNVIDLRAIPLAAIDIVTPGNDTLLITIDDLNSVATITVLNYGDGSAFTVVTPDEVSEESIVIPVTLSKTIAANDSNFYSFIGLEPGAFTFTLDLTDDNLNDIDLFIFDSSGNELSSSQFGGGVDESFTVFIAAGETYTIEVRWFSGADANAPYVLSVLPQVVADLVTVSFVAFVDEVFGELASNFSIGERVEISYTLAPSVLDANPNIFEGLYSGGVTRMSAHFANTGTSIEFNGRSVQTFNNSGSAAQLTDQVFVFGGSAITAVEVAGNTIDFMEFDFLSQATDNPFMLINDELPLTVLDFFEGTIFLSSSGDFTSINLTPLVRCFYDDPAAPDNPIVGTVGDDIINNAGATDVRICGASGNDDIIGTGENDFLHGNDGADRIDGGSGDDLIYGGDGDDVLIAGAGNDVLYGGPGNDTYIIDPSGGQDLIVDSEGRTTISFSEHHPDAVFTAQYAGDDLVITVEHAGKVNTLTLLDVNQTENLSFEFPGSNSSFIFDLTFSDPILKACVDQAARDDNVFFAEQLTTLVCSNQGLTSSVGIEQLKGLTSLDLSFNQLTSADVSANTLLTFLSLSGNQLTTLDVSNNNLLEVLFSSRNDLTNIDVSVNMLLKTLSLIDNNLTSLDVSSNVALEFLDLSGNQLTLLPLNNNVLLEVLELAENQIANIDLSDNPSLIRLVLLSNSLAQIDLSANEFLEYLSLSDNQLTQLDVSNNSQLTTLFSSRNQLSSVNLAANALLAQLSLYDNTITAIDISVNSALLFLSLYDNQLTAIDTASNPQLQVLELSSNKIADVDISSNVALTRLNLFNNNLSQIDISANVLLEYLNLSANQLVSLDVSNNLALATLFAGENLLTNIDITANTLLRQLALFDNGITSIDVSANTVLEFLNLSNNNLSEIDVSSNVALQQFLVNDNSLVDLDVVNKAALQIIAAQNNELVEIDVNSNVELVDLRLTGNPLSQAAIDSLAAINGRNGLVILFDTVIPMTGIFEDFESGVLDAAYSLSGDGLWGLTQATTNSGSFAIQAAGLVDGESATFSITKTTTAGFIEFALNVDSEFDFDFLVFSIDGVEVERFSGSLNWQTVRYVVAAGDHVFSWTYIKDEIVSQGDDVARIDDISFGVITQPNLLISNFSTDPSNISVGDSATISIEIINSGGASAAAFSTEIIINDGSSPVLFAVPALAVGETHIINSTVTTTIARKYLVDIELDVNNEVDEFDEANNQAGREYIVSSLPDQAGSLRWSFSTQAEVISSPAIATDGTIYVGSLDHNLYAVKPDGSLRWSFSTSDIIFSSPTVAADGTIYIVSIDNNIYAVNPDGTQKWAYDVGERVDGSPALGSDGSLYIASAFGNIFAINPDGSLQWTFATGNGIFSSIAVGQDGSLYIGAPDGLYALNADGRFQWLYQTDGPIFSSSPAVASDGTVYVGAFDNQLYAINPDGSLKWSYLTEAVINTSPVIAPDGSIYITSANFFYALNPEGSLKRLALVPDFTASSAAIGADGTIYIGSIDNSLYAFDSNGSIQYAYVTDAEVYSSPIVATDGTVYVGSNDGNLYAINSNSAGLADSAWPAFQQNSQRTGFKASPPTASFAGFSNIAIAAGSEPDSSISLALGDVDNDGDDDFLVANFGQTNKLYFNDGVGGFSAVGVNIGTSTNVTLSAAMGDINGDGHIDLVLGNLGSNLLFINDGGGGFPQTGISIGNELDETRSLALADVDADGDLDVIAGNINATNKVYVNDGSAGFSAAGTAVGSDAGSTEAIAVADIDGDGDLDVVAANFNQRNLSYLNDGNGSFDTTGTFIGTEADGSHALALADVDGDDDIDVIIGNDGQNRLYLNNGNGGFVSSSFNIGSELDASFAVTLRDVDGDSDPDLVVGNLGQNKLYLNDGSGGFALTGTGLGVETDQTYSLLISDFNADGSVDVIAGNRDQNNKIYLNETAGLIDKIKPVITLNVGNAITIILGNGYDDLGATAVDNVDGDISADIRVSGNVDANTTGLYILRYDVSDRAGNAAITVTRNVLVVDGTAPVVTAPASIIVAATNANGTAATQSEISAFLASATAIDDNDGVITPVNNAPSIFPLGIRVVTFSAQDSALQEGSAQATVTVTDQTQPSLSLLGGSEVSVNVGDSYSDAGISAVDNVDGDITAAVQISGSVNPDTVGVYTLTYNVSDAAGNTADSVSRSVSVIDHLAPVVTAPADIIIEDANVNGTAATDSVIVAFLAAASAIDNIDGEVTVLNNAPDVFPLGATTVIFTATDAAGNTGTAQAILFTTNLPLQQVAGKQSSISVVPRASFAATVVYSVSDHNANLSGLGLRIHFDSNLLTWNRFDNVLAVSKIGEDLQPVPDIENFDGDTSTDQYLSLAWASLASDWPASEPINLFDIQFTANTEFAQGSVTTLRFSSDDTAAGYQFGATPIEVVSGGSLDIDGSGDVTALTDGLLVIRHLFGFTDNALAGGAVNTSSCNRCDGADMTLYLVQLDGALDVDGDGVTGALTDGLLILRQLFGFSGASLISGAVGQNCNHCSAAEIIPNIERLVP